MTFTKAIFVLDVIQSMRPLLPIIVPLTATYGGIHLVAWNFEFPSHRVRIVENCLLHYNGKLSGYGDSSSICQILALLLCGDRAMAQVEKVSQLGPRKVRAGHCCCAGSNIYSLKSLPSDGVIPQPSPRTYRSLRRSALGLKHPTR